MFQNKSLTGWLSLVLGLAIAGAPMLAVAQEYRPPKRGLPGRREGAGTRGTCMKGQKNLMPLTPVDGFSATVSNSPTFFWYVPTTNASIAEFALLDGNDNQLYKTRVDLPGTAGIISFRVPENVTASVLAPDKDFYWQFTVICDPDRPSRNPFVEGVVQRVRPTQTLTSQLEKTASARDRVKIYATSGIWQDAISTLAQQRCLYSKDSSFQNSWAKLLQSVRLDDFVAEPLLTPCSTVGANSENK